MCFSSKQVYLDLSKILGLIYEKTLRMHDLAVYVCERIEGYVCQ